MNASISTGVHCHGYWLVNPASRRTMSYLTRIVAVFSDRARCCNSQPRSIASNAASSGARCRTFPGSSEDTDPVNPPNSTVASNTTMTHRVKSFSFIWPSEQPATAALFHLFGGCLKLEHRVQTCARVTLRDHRGQRLGQHLLLRPLLLHPRRGQRRLDRAGFSGRAAHIHHPGARSAQPAPGNGLRHILLLCGYPHMPFPGPATQPHVAVMHDRRPRRDLPERQRSCHLVRSHHPLSAIRSAHRKTPVTIRTDGAGPGPTCRRS